MQSAAALRESREVDLVVVELCRRLKQASFEEANVGGAGDQGAKDNRVNWVSTSSASDALQQRRDVLAVGTWFGRVLRAVEASPARGNQRSTQHCCLCRKYGAGRNESMVEQSITSASPHRKRDQLTRCERGQEQ